MTWPSYKGRWPLVRARDLQHMASIRGRGPEPEAARKMEINWTMRYWQQVLEGWTET